MRKTLLMTAAAICLAGGAMAQVGAGSGVTNSSGMTQTPPTSGGGAPPTMAQPAPMQQTAPGMVQGRTRPMHGALQRSGRGTTAVDDASAPPTTAYRGGAGSPLSNQASNTTAANTRSEIAPRLPDPNAASNSPQAFLAAAQRALNQGRTGAAQEALERAETRVLSRSTDASLAGQPDDAAMVRHISEARRALASRNTAGAKAAIGMAMAGGPGDASPPAGAMPQQGLGSAPGRTY